MTITFIISLTLLSVLSIPCQGILRIVVLWFPFCIFLALYGFYKGLVKYYGLKEKGETEVRKNKKIRGREKKVKSFLLSL